MVDRLTTALNITQEEHVNALRVNNLRALMARQIVTIFIIIQDVTEEPWDTGPVSRPQRFTFDFISSY